MTQTKSALIAALCAAVFAAGSVFAAAPKTQLPEPGTLVTLPVTASVEVDNDEAVVQLYVLEESRDVSGAAQAAVQKAADGLKALKAQYPQAEMKTMSLTSTPRYTEAKEGEASRIAAWQVRQTVSVTLKDVNQAAGFVQTAQKYFAFDHVGFQVSGAARESVQKRLVKDVIESLREQAAANAENLNGPHARVSFESIDFHNAAYTRAVPYRVNADLMRAQAYGAEASMALPVFDAGVTTLTRSLTAKVRIKAEPPKRVKPPKAPRPEPRESAPHP